MRRLVARLALGDDRAAGVSASALRGGALGSVTVLPKADYLFGPAGLGKVTSTQRARNDGDVR